MRVSSLEYFKPPQYKDAKSLIKTCKGDDVAVYMGLGQKYKNIASLEAERVIRLKEEMEKLKEEADYSARARKDLETAVKNLKADKQSFEEAEKLFGGKLNYKWSDSSFDALRGWVHNGEGGEVGKAAKALAAGAV
jgi:FtsZ-binding cell division protein ZapB